MERANAVGPGARVGRHGCWRAFGFAVGFAVLLSLSLSSACGSVTETASVVTCAAGGTGGTTNAGSGGTSGTGGQAGNNNPDLATPDQVVVLPCTICVRAQNCCKAQGLADCNYASACAAAASAEQNQFYLALCRAVLGGSNAGGKTPADVCGF
jgi:hypothetical protein